MSNEIIISKTGPWDKCNRTLKQVHETLLIRSEALMKENGELILNTMKQHIERQDLPWEPISQVSIAMGKDDLIWIETGFLKNNMLVKKVKSTKHQITFFVGVPEGITHPVSGNQLTDIAIWLEYGNSRQPPRPLFRPTWEEVTPIIIDLWTKMLDHVLSGGV